MKPKQFTVNGKPELWTLPMWELWNEHVAPLFKEGETCSTANYYTPRPYRNEYDRGSNKEGFVYVVNPGYRVCQWERTR